jgi:DNA invertase Pin-like site-specific DNA recombinase
VPPETGEVSRYSRTASHAMVRSRVRSAPRRMLRWTDRRFVVRGAGTDESLQPRLFGVRTGKTQAPTILVQDDHNFSEVSKVKKAAIYARISTPDQHLNTQLYDLRKLAAQRGFEITREYCDQGISGSKARRPGLDSMMNDARRGEFSIVLVSAFDRIARSTKNFLEIVDELGSVNIEFVSAREAIDTSGPMGRMFLTMVGSIAELERSLIVERIKAGMRRAKMEGRTLGRAPLSVDRNALVRDRLAGMSLTDVAKKYRISRASVVRVVRQAKQSQLVAAA